MHLRIFIQKYKILFEPPYVRPIFIFSTTLSDDILGVILLNHLKKNNQKKLTKGKIGRLVLVETTFCCAAVSRPPVMATIVKYTSFSIVSVKPNLNH